MKTAILADIHGNLEALEVVKLYLSNNSVDRICILGDTIGYGANPKECYEWVMENAEINIVGNHEQALIDQDLRGRFSLNARKAIEWTEQQLTNEIKKDIQNLGFTHEDDKWSCAHGSLHEPGLFHYLKTYEDAAPSFEYLRTCWCFVGHTHIPIWFQEWSKQAVPLTPGVIKLDECQQSLVNPGSVGQPRDQDKRLSFGVFDEESFEFELVRLKYDAQNAAQKIREAGLPAYLADRLL